MAKIALESWSQHGLFAVLHGHLHRTAVYDLNRIFELGGNHPVYDVMPGLLRHIGSIRISRIALMQLMKQEKSRNIVLMNS